MPKNLNRFNTLYECLHKVAMIEYQTTVNQGNSHQDRLSVVHRNETRPPSQQLPRQGLEPSSELIPHSFLSFSNIQKL